MAKIPFDKNDNTDDTLLVSKDYVLDNRTDGILRAFLRKIEAYIKSACETIMWQRHISIELQQPPLSVYVNKIDSCLFKIYCGIGRQKLMSGLSLPEMYQMINIAICYMEAIQDDKRFQVDDAVEKLHFAKNLIYELSKEIHTDFDNRYTKMLNTYKKGFMPFQQRYSAAIDFYDFRQDQ